jgi:cation:H+ antiporter
MIMFVTLCLALALMLDQELGPLDGIILLVSLVIIIVIIIKLAKSTPDDILAEEYEDELDEIKPVGRSVVLFILGLGLLLGGAQLLVYGAVNIATALGVSELVIGLTIIAIGTSLPELAASVVSVYKNEAEIAIGNVIGSNMFNMLMVLGVPPLIYPDSFGPEVIQRDFAVMFLLTIMMGLMVFLRKSGKFNRIEGGILFSIFIGYQYWLFYSTMAA